MNDRKEISDCVSDPKTPFDPPLADLGNQEKENYPGLKKGFAIGAMIGTVLYLGTVGYDLQPNDYSHYITYPHHLIGIVKMALLSAFSGGALGACVSVNYNHNHNKENKP